MDQLRFQIEAERKTHTLVSVNKKALRENSYARVKVLPYPIHLHSETGEELQLRDDVWMMVAREHDVEITNTTGEMHVITLGFDFIDGFTEDRCAPRDGLKRGILKLLGVIWLRRYYEARLTPLSRPTAENLVLQQEQLLARTQIAR